MIAEPHRAKEWLELVLSAGVVVLVMIEPCRRRSLGRVILDFGGHSQRGAQRGFGVLAGAWGLLQMYFVPANRFQGFLFLMQGCQILASSSRRFQLREAGIYGRKLFRWAEIEEFYLSPRGGLSLKLRGKDWVSSGSVPPDLWQEANEVLASRLPARQGVVFAA
jgi:hypothetical protein